MPIRSVFDSIYYHNGIGIAEHGLHGFSRNGGNCT